GMGFSDDGKRGRYFNVRTNILDGVMNWSVTHPHKTGMRPIQGHTSPHFFSHDFAQYARIDKAGAEVVIHRIQGVPLDTPPQLVLRRPNDKTILHAVAFSP